MRLRSRPSVSFSLALRFMLVLAVAMLSLSVLLVSVLRLSVARRQEAELRASLEKICATVEENGVEDIAFVDLAYYITYTVYEAEDKKVLVTNDSLLPLLDSGGKCLTYFVKGYFTDSDLHVRYLTRTILLGESRVVVECALDIANDSASQMLSALPRNVLILLVPVLLLSFALSFLISRRTITAFRNLQADYDRERAFTSSVSHELKTPISIIDGHANLLRRWGKDDPDQLRDSVDAILRETENMNAIVTTLLDMTRLEQGKVAVDRTRFFATNLFARLKEEFTALYPDMDFVIVDPDFVELETDEQKLHQIFTAVLSNSVKFAGKDTRITLCARRLGARHELSAADNGNGFPEEVLPHVFERFYKGDQSHARNAGGAGLGLSIAKALSEALGGSIRAENAPGGGARIVLVL